MFNLATTTPVACPTPQLTISDIIQIIGIILSLLTGIVAICISIATLKQNSKMIEESTRPYIDIYSAGVYVGSSTYYIVLKNFGQSSAFINSFDCEIDLSKCINSQHPTKPFQGIEKSNIVPGQSFHALIDFKKTTEQTDVLIFHISYSSGTHSYNQDIHLKLTANIGNLVNHTTTEGKELATISETLQDMYIHSL